MTSESKTFDRWDVVVALFPFTDIEVRKPRPVLVLSDRAFNQTHGHFIAAMITTGVDSQWPSDCRIEDLAACGLKHASLVRLKLFTLPLAVAATDRATGRSRSECRRTCSGAGPANRPSPPITRGNHLGLPADMRLHDGGELLAITRPEQPHHLDMFIHRPLPLRIRLVRGVAHALDAP
jgi:hypothetical protein